MFDISFTELMLIGVVALVVIGPERLPRVARTIGHLVGRAQRYVGDVKSDIQREMNLDELNDLKGQMEEAAKSVKSSVKDATDSLRDPIDDARKALQEASESVDTLVKATQDEISGRSATEEASDGTTSDDAKRKLQADAGGEANEHADMPGKALTDAELADARLNDPGMQARGADNATKQPTHQDVAPAVADTPKALEQPDEPERLGQVFDSEPDVEPQQRDTAENAGSVKPHHMPGTPQ